MLEDRLNVRTITRPVSEVVGKWVDFFKPKNKPPPGGWSFDIQGNYEGQQAIDAWSEARSRGPGDELEHVGLRLACKSFVGGAHKRKSPDS